jgi:N-acetylglutamate synthase-like GNAT family acetyltransferase
MNIAVRRIRRSTDTSHIEIRRAELKHVPRLVRLFGEYFYETQWGMFLTFDQDKCAARLSQLVQQEFTPHLVALDNGEIIGVISWHYDLQYTVEPIAVMDETFVLPPYRQSDLGRKLVALALHIAAKHKAPVFNFPIASGLPSTATLRNMLRKFGGEICGVIVRCIPQEEPYGRQR